MAKDEESKQNINVELLGVGSSWNRILYVGQVAISIIFESERKWSANGEAEHGRTSEEPTPTHG